MATNKNDMTQRDAFWNKLYEIAKVDQDIVVISADMGAPAIDQFRLNIASRFINVGIAEQNAILIASGLVQTGKKVYVYAIAPFITIRCLEQIRVNNCIMKFPITIVGVGAGFGYEDSGPTHHIIEDIAIMRSMPNIKINSISDVALAEAVAVESVKNETTNYVRLDRLILPQIYESTTDFSQGLGVLRKGSSYIVSTGSMSHMALDIAEELNQQGVNMGVIDVYTLPINEKNLIEALIGAEKIITLEEHFLPGGFGSAVCEVLIDNEIIIPTKRIGISQDKGYCYKYGGRQVIREYYEIDQVSVTRKINEFLTAAQFANV